METLRLDDLPDELILKVFSFLGTRGLICMGQMSNRIRAISHDEQLWQKINLYREPSKDLLMGEFMGMTFSNSETGITASGPQMAGVRFYYGHLLRSAVADHSSAKYDLLLD